MKFSREQVVRVYNEVERRISLMIIQRDIESEEELQNSRSLMRQGIYSTFMALAFNWEEVVMWIDEIERQ